MSGISAEDLEKLEEHTKALKGKWGYRRAKIVLLRLKHKKSAEEVGLLMGVNKRTVLKHVRRYRQEGLSAFEDHRRGPQGPRYMRREEEAALLEGFTEQALSGELMTPKLIKAAYEKQVGHPVWMQTIYQMLKRHRWSKLKPRPRHPKGCEEAKSLFKKTGETSERDC